MMLLLRFEFMKKKKFGAENWQILIQDQGLIQGSRGHRRGSSISQKQILLEKENKIQT